MIKNPYFLFASLIIVAIIVIVFYKMGTNPFLNTNQSPRQTSTSNQHQSDPTINLYTKNCAMCHGNFGEGLGGHPSLKITELSVEEIKEVIKSGRGEMPAFPGIQDPMLTDLAKLVEKFSSND